MSDAEHIGIYNVETMTWRKKNPPRRV